MFKCNISSTQMSCVKTDEMEHVHSVFITVDILEQHRTTSGCGQQTSICVCSTTNTSCQCALEQGCLSHPSVLPPPFIPPFLIPHPSSFLPSSLLPSLCSSIHQPPWFSLYLTLRGSAACIKYLETDGLVQQPGNLSTGRERGREAA